jgi:hypothetical protein
MKHYLAGLMFKQVIIGILCFNTLVVKSQELRLNEVRVLASHNSYKGFPDKKVLSFLTKFKKQLGDANDPIQLDYGHPTLPIQFDEYGIRGIEIDINYDPKGGLYKKRAVNKFICGLKTRIKNPVMKTPGFKVLHIADVDYETNYLTFTAVLLELKKWSEEHPKHTPIFVNIEAKGTNPGDESKALRFLGFKKSIPFSAEAYNALDKEIFAVLNRENIYQPQDLLGNYTNIKERLGSIGWPLESECLGKIIFILEGSHQELYNSETLNRPMFVYKSPNDINAAFVIQNDPIGNEAYIQELSKTYIVRTRSDAGTIDARNNDYRRFNAALNSKAQIISTDFYKNDARFGDFQIVIPK